jgi:hypothetical protein
LGVDGRDEWYQTVANLLLIMLDKANVLDVEKLGDTTGRLQLQSA